MRIKMIPQGYFILMITIAPILVSSELHSKCLLANGQDGSCELFNSCESAKKQILFGVLPQICDIEHVCCEDVRDIESSVESTEMDSPLGHQLSRKLVTQNCYAGITNDDSSDETNKLLYSTASDVSDDKKCIENEHNFLVKIGIRRTNGDLHFFCGGILIRPEFVLTPAHCLDYRGQPPEVVQIGNNANIDQQENMPISKFHPYPRYSKQTMYHDIALLELAISSSYMPVCIGNLDKTDIGKLVTFALGRDMNSLNEIQTMTVDMTSNDNCNEIYTSMRKAPHGILDTQLCVGNSNISEASKCKYYVGGPLLAKETSGEFYVIGLANYVHTCSSTNLPMIYTKISAYTQWLGDIFKQDKELLQ